MHLKPEHEAARGVWGLELLAAQRLLTQDRGGLTRTRREHPEEAREYRRILESLRRELVSARTAHRRAAQQYRWVLSLAAQFLRHRGV
ncbi:MAG: hypothetical protein QN188_08260 [Armatimonadota bacterium]|nr:hypothetical protein [Armatimonadota bacterium]MDR5674781.1 hypothetical protein [Armatimonadota bacterium]MDR5688698.1 hypothetical protein [Armatimonadota bacterium]MDR7386523.1 hypothetical protein [Armatimonadota bacterium]MDR7388150.1 hypothetical protein [Armatimonadota bacterium]